MYRVIFSPDAQKDVAKLQKKAPVAFKKLMYMKNLSNILELERDNVSSSNTFRKKLGLAVLTKNTVLFIVFMMML